MKIAFGSPDTAVLFSKRQVYTYVWMAGVLKLVTQTYPNFIQLRNGSTSLLFSGRLKDHFIPNSVVLQYRQSLLSLIPQFRQIASPRNGLEKKLLVGKRSLDFFNGFPKTFFFRRKDLPKNKKKRVPKLILVQNPLTWLMIKIDFRVLRTVWDPTFEETDFKLGTKQAISKVTQLISDGHYGDLNGLLTKPAKLSLMRELDRNWSDRQRSLLSLHRDDIQISSPRKVYFIRISDKKFCDVDMAFLALKWAPINSIEALIFTEIFARFHREYTPHTIPEWTIAYFKVTRFEVLRRTPVRSK